VPDKYSAGMSPVLRLQLRVCYWCKESASVTGMVTTVMGVGGGLIPSPFHGLFFALLPPFPLFHFSNVLLQIREENFTLVYHKMDGMRFLQYWFHRTFPFNSVWVYEWEEETALGKTRRYSQRYCSRTSTPCKSKESFLNQPEWTSSCHSSEPDD